MAVSMQLKTVGTRTIPVVYDITLDKHSVVALESMTQSESGVQSKFDFDVDSEMTQAVGLLVHSASANNK